MIRKFFILPLLCALMAVIMPSCIHRPLEDPYNGHYIRIYIDEHIKNVTYGFYDETRKKPEHIRPTILRVMLTDPISDRVISERYLQSTGEDERGYYIDGYVGAEAGNYNLMVYNFGTEKTKIRNDKKFFDAQAYTNPVSESYYQYFPMMQEEIESSAVRYCPDHLYLVTCEPVRINKNLYIDTLYNAEGDHFTAKTVALSYYLQVKIKGFEHVSTAVSLMSGMAGSTTLCNRKMNDADPVSIFFDMDYAEVGRTKDGETKTAVLYTTFNTFGKLPKENNIYTINFEFTRADGSSQVESIDITSMFDEPLVKYEQWILLEKEIEITPSEFTGGMTPGVDKWGDVWSDIQL